MANKADKKEVTGEVEQDEVTIDDMTAALGVLWDTQVCAMRRERRWFLYEGEEGGPLMPVLESATRVDLMTWLQGAVASAKRVIDKGAAAITKAGK